MLNTSTASRNRRFIVVLNRESGTLKKQWHDTLPDELAAAFAKHGVDAEVKAVAPDKVESTIKEALAEKPEALIVGGGDGTVSHAAGQLAGTGIPLGILPYGTFNLAARDLGIPLIPLEAAEALAVAQATEIDVLDMEGKACLCHCMFGFYPAMAAQEAEFRGQVWWVKSFRIFGRMRHAFHDCPPLTLTLTTGEQGELLRRTRFAAVVPGGYEDILSVIPKRLELSGGKIVVYLSRHRTLSGLFRAIIAYVFGILKSDSEMEIIETNTLILSSRRNREIHVSIDGEILKVRLPLRFTLKPRVLRVLKPSAGPE